MLSDRSFITLLMKYTATADLFRAGPKIKKEIIWKPGGVLSASGREKNMPDENQANLIAAAIQTALKQVQGAMPPANYMPAQTTSAQGFMPPAMQQQQPAGGVNPIGWSLPIEMNLNGFSFTVYLQFPTQMFPQCAQIVQALSTMGYQVRGGSHGGFNNGYNNSGGGYYRRNNWGRRY